MASHVVRVLAESKNCSSKVADQNTREGLFWWRGSDLNIELALAQNGAFLSGGEVGSIVVAVKEEGAPADAPVRMAKTLTGADIFTDFTPQRWESGNSSLCVARFSREEAALEAGTYRLIVLHTGPDGCRNTYLNSEITVKEDQYENVTLLAPLPLSVSSQVAALISSIEESGDLVAAAQSSAQEAVENARALIDATVANVSEASGEVLFDVSSQTPDRITIGDITYHFIPSSDAGPYPQNTIIFDESADLSNRDWAFAFFEAVGGSLSDSSPSPSGSSTPSFRSANLAGAHPDVTASFTPSFDPSEGRVLITARDAGSAGNSISSAAFGGGAFWLSDTLTGGADFSSPVLTYDAVEDIPERLFGVVGGELYFQCP